MSQNKRKIGGRVQTDPEKMDHHLPKNGPPEEEEEEEEEEIHTTTFTSVQQALQGGLSTTNTGDTVGR
jgi:hypothetical protein